MTLNILFFTITIKKNAVDLQKAHRQEMADKLYDQNRDRQMKLYHIM